MRFIVLITVFFLTISCSCNSRKLDAIDQNEILRFKVDSLNQVVVHRDSIIDDVLTLLSNVSISLDEIKRKEGMIITQSEIKRNSKEKISEDIDKISSLLDNNNIQLSQLNGLKKTLSDNKLRIKGFDKLILSLRRDIETRRKTLNDNRTKMIAFSKDIEGLSKEIEILHVNNEELLKSLGEKELDNQTKYFLFGEEKDLINRGVLLKEGFLVKTLKLNPNVDYTKFRKININDLDSVDLKSSKRVVLVGNFPSKSYRISKKDNSFNMLTIENKEEFWKGSLILVIAVK